MLMSRSLSSAASRTSSAQIRLASSSSTWVPRKMTRCRSSRWNTCSPNGITGASATRATASRDVIAACAVSAVGPAFSAVRPPSCALPALSTPGAIGRGCDTSLTWSPVPLQLVSLTVTITRCRRRFVLRTALFAVGAGRSAGSRWPGRPTAALLRCLRAGLGVLVLVLVLILVLTGGHGGLVGRILVRPFLAGLVLAGLVLVRGRPHVHLPARLIGDLGPLRDDVERLAAQHLGGHRAQLAVVSELPGQLVGIDAHPARLLGHERGHLAGIDAQLLLLGQLVEDEPGLDRPLRVALHIGIELGGRAAGRLQIVVEAGTELLELLDHRLAALLGLGRDHLFRQRHVDPVQQRVESPLPGLARLLHAPRALQLGPRPGPQLAHRVELARGLGELVV